MYMSCGVYYLSGRGGGCVEDVNAHGSVHINTLSNRYENFPPIDQQNSDVFPMILVILEFGANS